MVKRNIPMRRKAVEVKGDIPMKRRAVEVKGDIPMKRRAVDIGNLILNLGKYNNQYFSYIKLSRIVYQANCFYAQATGSVLFDEKNQGNMQSPSYDSLMDAYGISITSYITVIPKVQDELTVMQLMAIRKAMNLKPYHPYDAIEAATMTADTAKYL